jgi:ferredoxin-thioredoxin reductase catalytic subunit
MNPNEIELESIDKMFEFEKHSRVIDELSHDELKEFSKLYCKLYLKQQEVINSLGSIEI